MEGLICAYICTSRQHGMSHSAVHDATGDRAPQFFSPHSALIQCRCTADPWAAAPQKTHPSCTQIRRNTCHSCRAWRHVPQKCCDGHDIAERSMGRRVAGKREEQLARHGIRYQRSTSFPTGTSTMTLTDNTPKSVHQSFQGSCTHLRISNSTLKTSPRPFTSPTKCMNG